MVDVDEVYKSPFILKPPETKQKEPDLAKVNQQVKSLKLESTSEAKVDQASTSGSMKAVNTYRVVPELRLSSLVSQKFSIFHRHINQVMIRGDNVVMVAYAD